jgi:hypothetical protein
MRNSKAKLTEDAPFAFNHEPLNEDESLNSEQAARSAIASWRL